MKKLDKKKIASHLLAILLAVAGGLLGYYAYRYIGVTFGAALGYITGRLIVEV